ncbi:HAD family phosphatase [candidate division KSB1 bacterium]|nr:HAD family phosphatase [candidate division KSB1 bacterium]
MKIALIISDVDGCLTEERASAFNLSYLSKIREFNEQALQHGSPVPLLTLCTGRPQPYVEALLKILDVKLPAICENGGMIYQVEGNRYIQSDRYTVEWERRIQDIKQAIVSKVLPDAPATFQTGKETHLTLISTDHDGILSTASILKSRLETELKPFVLTVTENCLNIVPESFDKGTALLQLSQMLQIPLDRIAAIGDTSGDLPFMSRVKYPMCPANAAKIVKDMSSYTAKQPYTAGVIEIIETCIEINRGVRVENEE